MRQQIRTGIDKGPDNVDGQTHKMSAHLVNDGTDEVALQGTAPQPRTCPCSVGKVLRGCTANTSYERLCQCVQAALTGHVLHAGKPVEHVCYMLGVVPVQHSSRLWCVPDE